MDIETTGFSPDSSYVYLIGAAFAAGGKLHIRQWFMEEAAREKELLAAFLDFARDYKILAHYNGSTFDVPYLQKKCRKFHLADVFGGMQQWDIYKKLAPLKKLLGLADLKQRTVEAFIGVKREDPFHGGDLIPVYTEFIGRYRYEMLLRGGKAPFNVADIYNPVDECAAADISIKKDISTSENISASPDFQETGLRKMPESPAKALLHVLLLHNKEDLSGLLSISALLDISKIWEGGFSVQNEAEVWKKGILEAREENIPGDRECGYIHFSLSLFAEENAINHVFSRGIRRELPSRETISLSLENTENTKNTGRTLRLSVPIYHGTLKYFFEDYQEYYYLPMEDRAVHRSVAEFVDKAYRKKATRDTCYQKKTGNFLPQPEITFTPAFRKAPKSGISYFEPTPAFWEDGELIKGWILSLLCWLVK